MVWGFWMQNSDVSVGSGMTYSAVASHSSLPVPLSQTSSATIGTGCLAVRRNAECVSYMLPLLFSLKFYNRKTAAIADSSA